MNRCSGCGEDFGSVAAFDAHRAGRFDVSWPEDLDGRHCMDEDEMVLRGLDQLQQRVRVVFGNQLPEILDELGGIRCSHLDLAANAEVSSESDDVNVTAVGAKSLKVHACVNEATVVFCGHGGHDNHDN